MCEINHQLQVLSVLHKHKKEPNIEEMLYTLYKPLLWRALDAPNGDVRANATVLFMSYFPLIPARYNKVQFQDTLEEQCSKIKVCKTNELMLVMIYSERQTNYGDIGKLSSTFYILNLIFKNSLIMIF